MRGIEKQNIVRFCRDCPYTGSRSQFQLGVTYDPNWFLLYLTIEYGTRKLVARLNLCCPIDQTNPQRGSRTIMHCVYVTGSEINYAFFLNQYLFFRKYFWTWILKIKQARFGCNQTSKFLNGNGSCVIWINFTSTIRVGVFLLGPLIVCARDCLVSGLQFSLSRKLWWVNIVRYIQLGN